jgi:hypothetical protein
MIKRQLLRLNGLSAEIGVPVRTLQSLYHQRKIPFIKTGHRTVFFDPEKVRAALEKFEVRSVS